MKPHKTASGTVTASPLVLVDIQTDVGVLGHGIIFTYNLAILHSVIRLLEDLKPLVRGSSLAPKTLFESLCKRFLLLGNQGLIMMALAGIDMAAWDALGKCQGSPLVSLLGATAKRVPVYGSIGMEGPNLCAKEAEQWVQMGLTGVKVKIGYPSLKEDLDVIKSVRSAVGNQTIIMVDYNQALTRVEALHRLEALDTEDLGWIEEPLDAQDLVGHIALQKQIKTPLQMGENCWGPKAIQIAVESLSPSLLMLDVMKVGGVSGWLGALSLLGDRQPLLSSHLWPEISHQLLSLCENPHWLEYNDWWSDILENPLSLENGHTLSISPVGIGIEWKENEISNYLV